MIESKAMKQCGDNAGKRKRKVGNCCPGTFPDANGPPKTKRKKVTPRHKKATTKPATFSSLYVTGKKLGEGGCGAVFEGTRISDGLQVAIKFSKKALVQRVPSADGSKYVPIEVALMQGMNDPEVKNTIKLIEWFDEPNHCILILEWPQPCRDLYDFVVDHSKVLTEDIARYVMFQAVKSARECHERGVLHRDIKLENYLINTDTLELKLIDFGCGDWVKEEYSYWAGTTEYCPPEYFRERRYHAMPATVWSLGILMFTLVCQELPFHDEREILQGHLILKDGLSKECCDLVRWCLQATPTERPTFEQILHHDWFRCSDSA